MSVTAVPIQPVKRSYIAWLWFGILLAVAGAVLLAWQGTRDEVTEFFASNGARAGVTTTASGLQIETLEQPSGTTSPTDADVALILYEGKLLDGSVFDQSQQPTPIPVATVVPGFSEALKLMKKGGKYRIWIPAALAYGEEEKRGPDGRVVIPANSPLVFDVTLIEFMPEAVLRQMQMQQMGLGGAAAPGGGEAAPEGAPAPNEAH